MDDIITHDVATVLWLVLFGVLVWQAWFFSNPVAGLGLCQWASQAINHFIGEFFISRNEAFLSRDRMAAEAGFRLSGWAILGLLAAFAVNLVVQKRRNKGNGKTVKPAENADSRIGIAAVVYGFICYFVLSNLLSFIPSITSILSGGLSIAAVGLSWAYVVRLKKYGSTAGLITASFAVFFPVITLVLGGFMGFGIAAIFSVAAVVGVTHRPRWIIAIIGPVFLFLGLSLYPAYMLAREGIREKVWGGADLSARMTATVTGIGENWAWFDPSDEGQGAIMNGRLNQNVMVGYAESYISCGSANFAEGETIVDGLYALIPRAIWADKTIKAGSGGLVTRFTGIKFAEGTAVGIGNIMEFYVNFGISGIFYGFFVIGIFLYRLDSLAGESIRNLDYRSFFLCMVPGQSLMNAIGSFVEWGPSLVGGMILGYGFVMLCKGFDKKLAE